MKKSVKLIIIILFVFLFCSNTTVAQIRIGWFGDLNANSSNYDKGYFGNFLYIKNTSEPLSNTLSGGVYVSLRYDLNKFIAIRSDIEYQSIVNFDFFPYLINASTSSYKLTKSYTSKIIVPFTGCVYYDVGKYQIYNCFGFFGSYSNSRKQSIKDYDLGITDCVGVGYQIRKTLSINSELRYYRGFIDQHNTGSEFFKQPIYNNLLELSIGFTYLIGY